MQITQAEVVPVELKLKEPVKMAGFPKIEKIHAIFLRLETVKGRNAWGCTVIHPAITDEKLPDALRVLRACADMLPDLHPTNIEYTMSMITPFAAESSAAMCALDLVLHDLLGLAAGLPLYKLLGGYRDRIQTSVTVPLAGVQESVDIAQRHARAGFRMLKIKGGLNPDEDIRRVQAIHRALPHHVLRLDVDGAYTVQQAIDVAQVLQDQLEMLEQPTPAGDLEGLGEVRRHSVVPILADQSVCGPSSALELATKQIADGMSIKIATCGGIRCARQMDSIARAARLSLMVSCVVEPALMIAAGLSLALSSPGVSYSDLDGHLALVDDPTTAGFGMEDGYLIASDIPGLGCRVDL